MKAFGYIEGVIKNDFFSKKDLVHIIRAQREMSNHLISKPWPTHGAGSRGVNGTGAAEKRFW